MLKRHIYQEAAMAEPAGGGGAAAAAAAGAAASASAAASAANPSSSAAVAAAGAPAAPAEWLKPFGEHAKTFEAFKEPGEFVKAWNDTTAELKTLKEKGGFDWRKEAANGDEAISKTIGRYNDLPSMAKALQEAQTKIRSGELAKPLGKDATPEQVAEYRKANGIPEAPADYFKALPDGLVIGKDDQPVFDAYGKVFHDHNLPPAAVHALTKLYYDQQALVHAEERKVDQADTQKRISELRNEWGNDYAPNVAILDSFLSGMGGDLPAMFKDALLPDGTRLLNNTTIVKFLTGVARESNPLAHVLPAGGEGSMKSLESEIASIEKTMRENRTAYNKDEPMQARYRDLLAAREKLAGR